MCTTDDGDDDDDMAGIDFDDIESQEKKMKLSWEV